MVLEANAVLSPSIEKLEALLEHVPVFSKAAQQAQEIINQAEMEIGSLVPVLESEPSLAARVLRIANSPFYGFPRQIASIREACVVLGQHTLRNLIMSAAVLDILKANTTEVENCVIFSRHCVHTAVISRMLANKVGYSADIAYTTGLLHDIGNLFTCSLMSKEFIAVRRYMDAEGCSLEEAERKILGFDHACLSGRIVQSWKLPEEISTAILAHHDPTQGANRLAKIIYIADMISTFMQSDDSPLDPTKCIDPDILSNLNLSEESIAEFIEGCPTPDDPGLDILLNA